MKILTTSLLLVSLIILSGCDRINRASRTLDTFLGGDYRVHILGHDTVYQVDGGKITSEPEKGYYIFYPTVNGEETLVQSPIAITTIVKVD